ncbi:MAG: alpha/beta fold hydrolase [Actinomycetota bacterium]|nr:alpha/beta fold hydrolase [Actinomycetota bacterium]
MPSRVVPSTARPALVRAARRADDDYGAPGQPDWRTVDWPAHLHDVEIDGRRVHYADLGEGDDPPVVFVHGLAGCWQNFLENLPDTAQRRRAIALDLPGFGRSELSPGEVSITNYAGTVERLCDALELGPVVAVGNSMGGFVAADLALHFPARVERLALVAAAGISHADLRREPVRTIMRVGAEVATLGARRIEWFLTRPRLRQAAYAWVVRHPTRLAPDLLWEQAQGQGAPAYMLAIDAIAGYDFRDRLPEIGCPTLVVQGTDDMVVPLRDAYEFERLIPRSKTLIMRDTGHLPMLERAATFNRALREFVDAPAAEAAPPGEQVVEA